MLVDIPIVIEVVKRERSGSILRKRQWYFGMKLQIGTDRGGVVQRLTPTDGAAADRRLWASRMTVTQAEEAYGSRLGAERLWLWMPRRLL